MFLRCHARVKDGKRHVCWSVVENRRVGGGRVVQRQILYLSEINARQIEAWRQTIEQHDKTMNMVDVHVPTTNGRELVLSRYTQPEPEHRMLLDQLGLKLPNQPPPRITAGQLRHLAEPITL